MFFFDFLKRNNVEGTRSVKSLGKLESQRLRTGLKKKALIRFFDIILTNIESLNSQKRR